MERPHTSQSKSRRSWFDAPPLTTLDSRESQQIAKHPRPKQKSPDSVESLTLSHFTSAPRLSFGKVKVGHTKFRNILVRNPHDYEQEVIIERFPFKKKFSTHHTRFIVFPNEVFDLEITWTPDEEMSVREMILFHVNNVYRVQAYVFGTSEKPRAPRKVRRGILGPRVNQPTFVVQTPALTRIKSSYDRNSLESPVYGEKPKCNRSAEPFQASEDILRQHPLMSKEATHSHGNLRSRENIENLKPGEDIHYAISPLESTSVEGKLNEDQNQHEFRKISDTTCSALNTMSPIPVIGEVEKGFVVDSYFKNNETAVDESHVVAGKSTVKKADLKDTFVCHEISRKFEPGHGISSGTVIMASDHSDKVATISMHGKDEKGIKYEMASSSLIEMNEDKLAGYRANNLSNDIERQMRVNWSSPHLTVESPAMCQNPVSPNTQLNRSLNLISQMSTPYRRNHFSPQGSDSSVNASIISQGHGLVSPNSFMEDMRSCQQSNDRKRKIRDDSFAALESQERIRVEVPSPSRILHDSIPHDLMVKHLHSIQSSLHSSGSFIGVKTPLKPKSFKTKRRSITSLYRQKDQKQGTHSDESSRLGETTKRGRDVFNRIKAPLKQIPGKQCLSDSIAAASPRTGTSIISKKSPGGRRNIQKKRSPFKSQGKPGQTRKSPRSKRRQHSTDTYFTKVHKRNLCVKQEKLELPSHVPSDCLTPTRKSISVDGHTVVKSQSFETVEQDALQNGKYSQESSQLPDEEAKDLKSLSRKTLFLNETLGAVEYSDDFVKMEYGNLDAANLLQEESYRRIFAIDRKEFFVDKGANTVLPIFSDCGKTWQLDRKITNYSQEITTKIAKVGAKEIQVGEEVASPSHGFHTPTSTLPESYDPQLTRRSTHVVRSPKVIHVASMEQKCLNFDSALRNDQIFSPEESTASYTKSISDVTPQLCEVGMINGLFTGKGNVKYVHSAEPISVNGSLESPSESCHSTLPSHLNSNFDFKMNGSNHDSLSADSLETSLVSNASEGNHAIKSQLESEFCIEKQQVVCREILAAASESSSCQQIKEPQDISSHQIIEPADCEKPDVLNELNAVSTNGYESEYEMPKLSDVSATTTKCEPADESHCFSKPATVALHHKSHKLQRKSISMSSLCEISAEKPEVVAEVYSFDQSSQSDHERAVKVQRGSASIRSNSSSRLLEKNNSKCEDTLLRIGKIRSRATSYVNVHPSTREKSTAAFGNMGVAPLVKTSTYPGFSSKSQSVDCLNPRKTTKANRDVPTSLKKNLSGQQETKLGKLAGDKRKAGPIVKSVAKPAKGVAQSRLILIKKSTKTAPPRHPMPFAARNMYYDERWKEKQERGFVQWLNFVLTPPDEYVAATTHLKIDVGALTLNSHQVAPSLAPTKEILSFRAYAARRRLNRLRKAACELYHSDNVVSVIRKIEIEVESGRILVRKEKMVHADLGIRQKLLDLLLHYNSLWLRIGLETIFGEMLMLQSNTDIIGLSRFIVTRLLGCPDIAEEYAHPTVPHLYKEGYATALSRHCLKKFLLLVYFLDRAKTVRLIDHDPCLFSKGATIKASREILVEFSREVLSGEGDLVRHLAYFGYNVQQKQRPIDEFDYAVTNLSSDLKDGLRLSRIVELLASDTSIIGKLRAPAISRLQKVHNMEVFFRIMKELGLDFVKDQQIISRDIVDGHREKTLSLLWHLILHFQAYIQVNEEHLQEEIKLLTKSLQLKLAMQKIGVFQYEESQARRDSSDGQPLDLNSRMQLIFRWCQLVCLHYGIKMDNFTVSFSDGRAFCCLLHHYHSALLPQSEINFETTLSFQAKADLLCDEEEANLSMEYDRKSSNLLHSEADPAVFQRLLANEKANFKTLYEKVSALGGVPLMVKSTDMSNTIPDERVVSTYVAYLCARLLDIREEVKAARVIQMAWRRKKIHRDFCLRQRAVLTIQRNFRKYLIKKRVIEKKLLEEKQKEMENATVVIQTRLRSFLVMKKFLAFRKSVLVIQTLWRRRKAAKIARMELVERRVKREAEQRIKMEQGAILLQKHTRRWLNEKMLQKKKLSAVCIQKFWKGYLDRLYTKSLRFELQSKCATTIQKWVRRKICMNNYQKKRCSIIVLQKTWRMVLAQNHFNDTMRKRYDAALVVQKYWRGRICSKQFGEIKKSAIVIQSFWRSRIARKRAEAIRKMQWDTAAITIQRFYRSYAVRKSFLKRKQAATIIQIHWKKLFAERQRLLLEAEMQRRKTEAALCLQNNVRGWLWRKRLQREAKAALAIQKWWRGYSARRFVAALRFNIQSKSAIIIQKWIRRRICMNKYQRTKSCIIVLQSKWRMILTQREFALWKERTNAAVVFQKLYRAQVCLRRFNEMKRSTIFVQSCWRGYKARLYANSLRLARHEAAATIIQKNWRSHITHAHFKEMKNATIVFQKYCRRWLAKKEAHFLSEKRKTFAAVNIQKNLKRWIDRRKFLQLKKATLMMQKTWRMKVAVKCLNDLKSERDTLCAIRIQAVWRGYLTRRTLQRWKAAAIAIQANWKTFCQKREFSQLKVATIYIQRRYRAMILSRRDRDDYLKLQKSVVFLQSLVRRRKALQDFCSMKQAAIVIQSNFRMFKRRIKYQALKLATIIVQRAYRNYQHGKLVRQHYLTIRHSTVVLQRHYRNHLLFKKLKQEKSAITLQAAARRFLIQRKFHKQKQAAVVIQRGFRAMQDMKDKKRDYLEKRRAIIAIQSYYRMHLAQKCLIHLKNVYNRKAESAVKIQSFFKRYMAQREYRKQRNTIIVLQRWCRNVFRMRQERAEFIHLRSSVIKLQSLYRMHSECKRYCEKRKAVICLQAFARRLKAEGHFHTTRNAALVIQSHFRAWKIGQTDHAAFLSLKKGAIAIQRFYRQRVLMRRTEKLILLQYEAAAVIIQGKFRAMKHMRDVKREYLEKRRAISIIQSFFRMHLAQTRLVQLKKIHNNKVRSVVKIQSCFRRYRMQTEYSRQRNAVIFLQRRCRTIFMMRQERAKFIHLRSSVIKLQSLYRMHSERKRYCEKRKAVICLQAFARRLKAEGHFHTTRNAALVIQSHFRAWKIGQTDHAAFLSLKKGAIAIQRFYRQRVLMREKEKLILLQYEAAAVIIQGKFRAMKHMRDVKREYLKKRRAITTIQSFFRMHLAQKRLAQLKKIHNNEVKSAVKIQSFFRRYRVQTEYNRQRNAVIFLQRRCRTIFMMRQERAKFIHLRSSVIKLQSLYRMHSERKSYCEKCKAVICLQAFARRLKAEGHFHMTRNAALVIQSHFRAWKIGQTDHATFLSLKKSAIAIQRFYRQRVLMREKEKLIILQHGAAVKIQSFYRGTKQRKKYMSFMASVICIQERFRASRQGRFVRLKMQECQSACIIIQHAWKQFYNIKKAKALLQQRRFQIEEERRQMAIQRSLAKRQQNSAVVIQRAFREFLLYKQHKKIVAATKIQTFVRQALARRSYLTLLRSVATIQAHFRGYKDRQELKELRIKRDAAILLQARVRGYLTRKRVQPILLERINLVREYCLRQKCATKIQALWRGFMVRKDNTNKRLLRARRRVEEINRSATEQKTLGYRTSLALDYLFRDKDSAFILEALMHLEVATRLSPVCCERVAEVNATAILFQLISSCNRSLPHMDIIHYSILIILNLSKYQKTVHSILMVTDAVAVIIDLLQIYREKGIIFFKTCELLGTLALDPHRRQIILAHERIQERLQSIHTLVLRKHRCQQNQQATKAKLAAMKSFNSTLPISGHLATPSKKYHVAPKWNLSKKKTKEFENPLTAMSFVMDVLRIGPK